VGAFVGITATGRLAPVETISGMVSFAWLPLSHALGLFVAVRVLARPTAFTRAYALFLESLGPWMVVLLVVSGCCLFAPRPAQPIFVLLGPLVLGASVWSVILVFALFRAALSLSRRRAFAATALFYVAMLSVVLGYYFAVGQLWPVMAW
jgi:hypothetical protein